MKSYKNYISWPIVFAFILCFMAISGLDHALAYTPPIGIPDPGMWGNTHPIDSPAPAKDTKCPNWPVAQTTNCYYIDNTHPQATDTGNIYGYPDKPRATIPSATYAAGAYIEVHGGPYNSAATLTMNGTAENPIWFRGESPTSKPVIRAKILLSDSKYVIIENLEFNNFTGAAIRIGGMSANNICVRNSSFHDLTYPGSPTSVIGSTPTQGGSIHDLVFYKNSFENIGNWQTATDDDYHAINPNLWGRTPPTTQYNIWVLNNFGYHISGNLAQFNGDQRDIEKAKIEGRTETNLQNFHHMYVGFNYAHHNRQDLSVAKFTTDAIISQNVMHDNYSTSSSCGTGVVFQEGPNYVWIIFNKMYNMDFGVRQGNMYYDSFSDQKTFMVGNVIYNLYKNTKAYNDADRYKPAQGISFEKGKHKRYLIDNTIYNVGGGINISTVLNTDLAIMSGNVIAGVYGIDDNGDTDHHISRIDTIGTVTVDYGFFQPRADNGNIQFYWAGVGKKLTLESFQVASGQCLNCWSGDPKFLDPAKYNLKPAAGSPLIGKGIKHSVYNEFQVRYGLNIAYDVDGRTRPETGPWTLGAYEYSTIIPAPIIDLIAPK